jgi:DNA-binding NarL/FixJ family response regulator
MHGAIVEARFQARRPQPRTVASVAQSAALSIILVHRHEVVRDALRQRLMTEQDVDVVASVATDPEAIDALVAHPGSLVLTDQRVSDVGEVDEVDLPTLLRRADPNVQIVMLCESDELTVAVSAIKSGVAGIVRSNTTPSGLVHTMRVVAGGGCVIDREALATLAQAWDDVPRNPLSVREREVLSCLADGLTNAEVAAQLFVSKETVKTHVAKVLRKLDVDDRRAAVDKAMRLGQLTTHFDPRRSRISA